MFNIEIDVVFGLKDIKAPLEELPIDIEIRRNSSGLDYMCQIGNFDNAKLELEKSEGTIQSYIFSTVYDDNEVVSELSKIFISHEIAHRIIEVETNKIISELDW